MSNGLDFDFDDSESMEDLLGGITPKGKQPSQKRKPKVLPDHTPGVDLDSMDDMEDLLQRHEEEALEHEPPKPSQEEIDRAMPTDIFGSVDDKSMDDLINGEPEQQGESLTGRIKELSIQGVLVDLGAGREGRIGKEAFSDWSAVNLGDEVLVMLGPDYPGPIYNLELLKLHASHREHVSKPHQKPSPGVLFKPGSRFVIDGSNVCRSYSGDDGSSLAPLLTLATALVENNASFICVFDANERYALGQNRKEPGSERIYEELLSQHSKLFVEGPGGRDADEYLLKIAHRDRLPVISNDHFNKHGDSYQHEYSWLHHRSSRLIQGNAEHGFVTILRLGLHTPLRTDLREMLNELRAPG